MFKNGIELHHVLSAIIGVLIAIIIMMIGGFGI
ncbi:hypothetical protein PQE75_gp087 [Bacillus phage vB_BcoS-136]|uniref:Uncharacterized protein n=1 Tax=Bacillus phage vB_BcoS-136 TaxID=2419619 RepID=A0A3G3BVE1_9CAUD|nr:hypothetical protein PQE75_gp087 [Bacillus phage vB_BcoS-136]AYP68219.1 hypothetical protein vBBcoS136_00087 [Bacillus phage vB_BcoS-136]